MKKRLFAFAILVVAIVALLAISASAAEWTYKDEAGTVYLTLTIDDSTKVVTEYDGRFPMWDEDNNPLTWYVIETDTTNNVKTVKSFVSTDPAYTNHGNGYFRFIQEANFNVDGYPVPTKENVVSMNMPNDMGITAFSNYSAVNFQAGVNYTPDKLELLFLRCPNTMTNTTRLAQASKILEVEFDENSTFTELSHLSFHESRSLRKINIPASVEKILSQSDTNGRAFYNCVSLEQITFDEGSNLQIIQSGAFKGCSSLKEIQFPASMVTVDNNVLSYISGLEIVRLSENFTHFINTDGNGNVRDDHHSFTYNSTNIKEYYLPVTFYATAPTTTYQVSYAFSGATSNCKFFYCGTVEDFETAKQNFLTQTSATSNNGKFTNATVITYSDYLESPDSYATGNYVICNYNMCDAFYDGKHIYNNDCTDADNCANGCGLDTTKSDGHAIEQTLTYENTFASSGKLCTSCKNAGCTVSNNEETTLPILIASGYSTNSKTGIAGGFTIDKELLIKYNELNGTDISFGIMIANPTHIGDSFFNSNKELNLIEGKNGAIQIVIDSVDYSNISYAINGFTGNENFELVICMYAYTDGDVQLIQSTDSGCYVSTVEKTDASLKTVSYNSVVNVASQQDAILPDEE